MKRKKLIAARIKKCGEQQILADRLGVSRTEVSYWENGHKTPHPHYQLELCKLLGFDDPVVLLEIDYTDEEACKSMAPTAESPLQVAASEDGTTEEEAHEGMAPTAESSMPSEWDNTTSSAPIVISVPCAVQDFISSNLTNRLWHIAHTQYRAPSDMTTAVRQAIEEFNAMNTGHPTFEITRREALCSLAALPMTTLGQNPRITTHHYTQIIMHCTAALEACWQLYQGNDPCGRQHAFECTNTYVPLLKTIARDSSQHQKEALNLATRYALLQTLLGWQCAKSWETVNYAQNARDLSKETGDILLQVSACPKLSWTYLTDGQYTRAWKAMQEGEQALKNYQRKKKGPPIPSGLIGNFYSSYSLAQIHNGIDPDVALGIATDSEPIKGCIALVEFAAFSQWLEAAEIYCAKGDSAQAMMWLNRLIDPETLTTRPDVSQSEREWIETINVLTQSLLQSQEERDMERIIATWTVGMEGAQALKHEVRYQEAFANFAVMKALYPGERRIMKLIPLTSHW